MDKYLIEPHFNTSELSPLSRLWIICMSGQLTVKPLRKQLDPTYYFPRWICDLYYLSDNETWVSKEIRIDKSLCCGSSWQKIKIKKHGNKETTEHKLLQFGPTPPPAGIFCFVQVSVRKSILPVQDSAYQLPSSKEEYTYGHTKERIVVQYFQMHWNTCYLQALSPLDRTTSQ